MTLRGMNVNNLLYLFQFCMHTLKMAAIDAETRWGIIALQKAGHSHSKIGTILGLPSASVSTTICRFKATGTTASAPRSGRPPKITLRGQRRVLGEIAVNPNRPWSDYAGDFNVSPSTIMRTAASDRLHKRHARKKPHLTPGQVEKRLNWAGSNKDTCWSSVIFTDEASVESGVRKGVSCTIRRPHEEFKQKHLVPTFK